MINKEKIKLVDSLMEDANKAKGENINDVYKVFQRTLMIIKKIYPSPRNHYKMEVMKLEMLPSVDKLDHLKSIFDVIKEDLGISR